MDPNLPRGGFQELPLAATVVPELPPGGGTPPRRGGRTPGRWALALLVLVLAGSVVLNILLMGVAAWSELVSFDSESRVQEKFFSHNKHGGDKVAILSIEGVILESEGFFKREIDHALKDAENGKLKAIVLRVNSPGGDVSSSDYLYHHLRKLREKTDVPIVVSMGGMAASGGYYVAMACGDQPNVIYAEPTTWTGSIGVIIPHFDLSDLLKNWGVQENSIVSARLKDMGSPFKPMTDEEHEILQALVNDGFARFKEVVQQGRPAFKQNPAKLNELATGQVFTAHQALQSGLIDRIGFVEEAIGRAIELAGLEESNVKVVRYKREPSLADILLSGQARQPSLDLAKILGMTVPRAYYLCTRLPPVAGRP